MPNLLTSRFTGFLAVLAIFASAIASESVLALLPDAAAATIASIAGLVLLLTKSLAPTAPSVRDVLGSKTLAVISTLGVVAGALVQGDVVNLLPDRVGLWVMFGCTFVLAFTRSLSGAEDRDGDGVPDYLQRPKYDGGVPIYPPPATRSVYPPSSTPLPGVQAPGPSVSDDALEDDVSPFGV